MFTEDFEPKKQHGNYKTEAKLHYISFYNNYNWGSERVTSTRLFYKLKYSEGVSHKIPQILSAEKETSLYKNKKCIDTVQKMKILNQIQT